MPEVRARRATLEEVRGLRDNFRSEARCQIVRDSILPRKLAGPFLFEAEAEVVGYCGVWQAHFPGRIMEFVPRSAYRDRATQMVTALREITDVTEMEVQTNLIDGATLLAECVGDVWVENLLFEEGAETHVERPDVSFRARRSGDGGPEGDWVVERGGQVVGAGGWLTHYNPPYADLYMEVTPAFRGQGLGGYLIQELRRACRRAGHVAAARCDPDNEASRRTLERGGLRSCGRILAGTLRREPNNRNGTEAG